MAAEGVFPKVDGDFLYASEVNSFENDKVATAVAGVGIDVSSSIGNVTISSETASTTNPGIMEIATVTEVSTGTDNTRAVIPLGLATSDPPRILENRTSDPSSTTGRIWIRTDL